MAARLPHGPGPCPPSRPRHFPYPPWSPPTDPARPPCPARPPAWGLAPRAQPEVRALQATSRFLRRQPGDVWDLGGRRAAWVAPRVARALLPCRSASCPRCRTRGRDHSRVRAGPPTDLGSQGREPVTYAPEVLG